MGQGLEKLPSLCQVKGELGRCDSSFGKVWNGGIGSTCIEIVCIEKGGLGSYCMKRDRGEKMSWSLSSG